MKLLFRRQRFSFPPRIGTRLCVTNIDRPGGLEWNISEHGAAQKAVAALLPKPRVGYTRFIDPFPGAAAPELPLPISSGLHELGKLPVRNLVLIDGKCRDMNAMIAEFVIPSTPLRWIDPECGGSGRNLGLTILRLPVSGFD